MRVPSPNALHPCCSTPYGGYPLPLSILPFFILIKCSPPTLPTFFLLILLTCLLPSPMSLMIYWLTGISPSQFAGSTRAESGHGQRTSKFPFWRRPPKPPFRDHHLSLPPPLACTMSGNAIAHLCNAMTPDEHIPSSPMTHHPSSILLFGVSSHLNLAPCSVPLFSWLPITPSMRTTPTNSAPLQGTTPPARTAAADGPSIMSSIIVTHFGNPVVSSSTHSLPLISFHRLLVAATLFNFSMQLKPSYVRSCPLHPTHPGINVLKRSPLTPQWLRKLGARSTLFLFLTSVYTTHSLRIHDGLPWPYISSDYIPTQMCSFVCLIVL